MTAPHLRVLTDRRAPLPPALAARAEVWRRCAEAAATTLGRLFGAEVTAGAPALSLADAATLAKAEPGVLCPLTDGRGHIQVAAPDALRMTAMLLRSDEAFAEAGLLDALLVRSVAEAVANAAAEAFGVPLATDAAAPQLGWPVTGFAGATLCIDLPFEADGAPVAARLLLAAPHAPYAAPDTARAPSPALRRAALAAPAAVEAVLDSWSVSPAAAAALKVGAVLALPGASVEALELRVRTSAGAARVGEGELGRARGQQAVRVTRAA